MTTPSEDSIAQSEAIAALAKHSWHFNIESINSNTPLSTSVAYLIFLSLWLVACAPAISTAKPTPVLVLSSSGRTMDGPHPTYKFEIYEDGFVQYHGDINVKTIGDRQAKITPEQVQQLIATYRKIEEVFKEYERGTGQKLISYHGHYLFQLQYQGETSQLGVGGYANDMFRNLNKMTPIESWICFPENDPLTHIHGDCPVRRWLGKPNIYPID